MGVEEDLREALEKLRAEHGKEIEIDIDEIVSKLESAYILAEQGLPTTGWLIGEISDKIYIEDVVFEHEGEKIEDLLAKGFEVVGSVECKPSEVVAKEIPALQEALRAVRKFKFGGIGGFFPRDLENVTEKEAYEILKKIITDLNREGEAVMRQKYDPQLKQEAQPKTLKIIKGLRVTIQPAMDEYRRRTFLAEIELSVSTAPKEEVKLVASVAPASTLVPQFIPTTAAPASPAFTLIQERELLKKYDGFGTVSEKLVSEEGYKWEGDIWLYSPEGTSEEQEYDVVAADGTKHKIIYKFHVTATPKDFDTIILEMVHKLSSMRLLHKIAPGKKVATPAMGTQYGKVITIYAGKYNDKADAIKVFLEIIDKAKELADMGLQGISHDEFVSTGANLQYEAPVPGTNNILYYTIERFDGRYLGSGHYYERKDIMLNFWGQGPIDYFFGARPFFPVAPLLPPTTLVKVPPPAAPKPVAKPTQTAAVPVPARVPITPTPAVTPKIGKPTPTPRPIGWTCSFCGTQNSQNYITCASCGYDKYGRSPTPALISPALPTRITSTAPPKEIPILILIGGGIILFIMLIIFVIVFINYYTTI